MTMIPAQGETRRQPVLGPVTILYHKCFTVQDGTNKIYQTDKKQSLYIKIHKIWDELCNLSKFWTFNLNRK